MLARFILDGCRSTGKGAYTSMGGTHFQESGSGNNWKEWMEVEVGDTISIINISNSGKHNCHVIEITAIEPVEWKTVKEADEDHCPVCDGN